MEEIMARMAMPHMPLRAHYKHAKPLLFLHLVFIGLFRLFS